MGAKQYVGAGRSSPSHDWSLTDGGVVVNDRRVSLHLDWLLSSFRLWREWEGKKWSNSIGRTGKGDYR